MVYILIAVAVILASLIFFLQPREPEKVRIPVDTTVGRQRKQ
jgi:hypothetical protein